MGTSMTTSDIVGLSGWSVFAGLIAFVVLHHNIDGALRSKVIRWLVRVGGLAAAFFVAHLLLGLKVMPTRGALGLAFVGLPALVAGVLLQVASFRKKG